MYLYIDKNTDQMRSTFIAVGLATLLEKLFPIGARQTVTLYDQGSCYVVESKFDEHALTQQVQNRGDLPPLLPAISKPLTGKEQALLETGERTEEELLAKYLPPGFEARGGTHIKYGNAKQTFDTWRKYRPKKNDVREQDEPDAPHRDFPVWAHLNSYFGKGSAMRVGYPGLVHTWHAHQDDAAMQLWKLIIMCYSTFPNEVDGARKHWTHEIAPLLATKGKKIDALTSALAVVSPSTSKGVSAASGFNRLVEDTLSEFWLEMYFAFVGFLEVAMPYNLGGDIVTYYPIPREITLFTLKNIIVAHRNSGAAMSLYRYSNSQPRIKLDTLNQITFYHNMLTHFADVAAMNDGTMPEDTPLDAIGGLIGYYYKDISTQIPFDETMFALPAWLPRSDNLDVLERAKEIMNTHYNLIECIRGRKPKYQITADELVIINAYRRYITHGEANDWVSFVIYFGLYSFRYMTEMSFPKITFALFKESFPMSLNDHKDYRPILDNLGFKHIAGAINYCTAYSRFKKDVQKDRTFAFKVRHGLGDDLMRNAHDPELFLLDLSKFVHDYRRESINVQVNTSKTRSEISPEDLYEITGLVAEYGSRIVAHLLVAVGYAVRFESGD